MCQQSRSGSGKQSDESEWSGRCKETRDRLALQATLEARDIIPKVGDNCAVQLPPEVLALLGALEEVIQADSGLGRAFIVEIYPRP